MFEETNQTEAMEENLFDNTSLEETTEEFDFSDNQETTENSDTETEQTSSDSSETVTAPETHEIVYNGQKISLTLDELKTNAQKGMNYDKVHEQLQNLRNSPALGIMEKYAKKSGMSIEQYVEYLQKADEQQRINQMKNEGVPEAIAKRMVDLEEKERIRSEREEIEKKVSSQNDQFQRFIKEYPGVKASDIPEEVWQRFRDGMGLVESYAIYENKNLRNQIEQYKQNEVNKQKSVGSVKGDSAETNSDSFLEGLFGKN